MIGSGYCSYIIWRIYSRYILTLFSSFLHTIRHIFRLSYICYLKCIDFDEGGKGITRRKSCTDEVAPW